MGVSSCSLKPQNYLILSYSQNLHYCYYPRLLASSKNKGQMRE